LAQSVEAMKAIPARMIEAWNRADAAGFFADFADGAVSVEVEETIFRSRTDMIAAQETMFGTVLKGSRLVRGEVPFAKIVSPGVGVVHHRVGLLMPGEKKALATRFFMQFYVMVWRDDRWVVAAMENARLLSLETMAAIETMTAG
jgi:uncharacterized protein (TIGR02246 family)